MSILKLNEENFQNEISKGITLVDFWATWCGPCRMLNPILENLAEEFLNKAKIAKINVDEEGELTQNFDVTTIPTMILFKDGKEVDRINGVNTQNFITEKINNLLK